VKLPMIGRLAIAVIVLSLALAGVAPSAHAQSTQEPATPTTTSSDGSDTDIRSPGDRSIQQTESATAFCPPAPPGAICNVRFSVLLGSWNIVFCYWPFPGEPTCLPPGVGSCHTAICEHIWAGGGSNVIPISFTITGHDPVIHDIYI
jgi:hypothetical protein